MAIFKCKEDWYISITQETLKKINALKRTKLGLTKVFNHIKFISTALKKKVTPVGFRRNFAMEVINRKATQQKIGILLMKDTLEGLYIKQKRLIQEEEKSRKDIMLRLRPDEWELLEGKLLEMEKSFVETRMKQINKMGRLIQQRDESLEMKECQIKNGKARGRVLNLSKHELSEHEEQILLKGLEFTPSDQRTNKLELAVNVENLMKRLSLKDENLPKELMAIMCKKDKHFDNLTYKNRDAMENLCKLKDIIITTSDKGKITVILDKIDYDSKLYDVLLGGDYEILDKDPTKKIENKLKQIVAKIRKKTGNVKLYYKLIGGDTRWPGIFGNPKVHKTGNPMRVIISSFGTVLEKAGSYIKNILNRYVGSWKNSSISLGIIHMKEEILDKKLYFGTNSKLASIDVVSMFNNITVEKAYSIIKKLVNEDSEFKSHCELDKEDFLELTTLVLSNSYFKHEEDFYKQIHGIPMGSGISPVVSDLVMLDLEDKMSELPGYKYVEWYRRYRDDGFIIWEGSRGELEEFVEDLNMLDESRKIKFTMEFESQGCLPFLDAKLSLDEGKLKFEIFEKPYSAKMLLNYNSYQDVGIKRAIIAGETLRYLKVSDNHEQDLSDLRVKLKENDYPEREVNNVMAATEKKWREKTRRTDKGNEKDKSVYLSLHYPGKKKAKDIRKLGKRYGFKPAFRRNKTLGNRFSKNYKQRTNRDKGLIYSIKCKCGSEYIGETSKDMGTRVKGHKNSIRTLDTNNGLAVHIQDCDKGIDWEGIDILGWEGNWNRRKIKESLWIQRRNPKLNLNSGWKIRGNWN